MAERARTACYERRMMYLERTIRRLSSRDGELRANNKPTARVKPAARDHNRGLVPASRADKQRLLTGRDLDDKTTSRVPPGTPRDAEIRGWSLQARLSAREGGLKSLEVLWVLEVDSDRRRRPRGPANGRTSSHREADFAELQIGN